MKKIISLLLITGFLFCLTHAANAQKKLKEGKAIFSITYPESELDEQTLAMMPSETVIYFKDKHSRTEMKIAMGTTVSISDAKTGEMTTLIDMMGNKIAMKITKEDLEKEIKKNGNQKPDIKITDETKKIAGYNCKKLQAIVKDENSNEIKMDVWFTDEIEAPNSMRGGEMFTDKIDGFMMEFETKMNTLSMKMTCRLAEAATLPDSMFTIPEGYTLTTMEEMKNLGGVH